MKRYRYGDPSSQSVLQKARPYILLFVAWNLAGAMIWKFANSRAQKSDPEWFSKSETERIVSLTGGSPSTTQKISFSLGSKKDEDTPSS